MIGSVTSSSQISVRGLTRQFKTRDGVLDAVRGIDFDVSGGEIVGLLGPNGAGKSTAMRVLLGLQRPTSGAARILGHEAGSAGFRAATRRVGAIIEAPPLYKNATALLRNWLSHLSDGAQAVSPLSPYSNL